MFKYLLFFKLEVNFPLMEITPVDHDHSLDESFPLDAALPLFYPSLLPQLLLLQRWLRTIPLRKEQGAKLIKSLNAKHLSVCGCSSCLICKT